MKTNKPTLTRLTPNERESNRFELPQCRNEAILIAMKTEDTDKDNVQNAAIRWLDCALNDALVLLEKTQTPEKIPKAAFWQSVKQASKEVASWPAWKQTGEIPLDNHQEIFAVLKEGEDITEHKEPELALCKPADSSRYQGPTMTPELLITFRSDLETITDSTLPAWLIEGAKLCAATLATRIPQPPWTPQKETPPTPTLNTIQPPKMSGEDIGGISQ